MIDPLGEGEPGLGSLPIAGISGYYLDMLFCSVADFLKVI